MYSRCEDVITTTKKKPSPLVFIRPWQLKLHFIDRFFWKESLVNNWDIPSVVCTAAINRSKTDWKPKKGWKKLDDEVVRLWMVFDCVPFSSFNNFYVNSKKAYNIARLESKLSSIFFSEKIFDETKMKVQWL